MCIHKVINSYAIFVTHTLRLEQKRCLYWSYGFCTCFLLFFLTGRLGLVVVLSFLWASLAQTYTPHRETYLSRNGRNVQNLHHFCCRKFVNNVCKTSGSLLFVRNVGYKPSAAAPNSRERNRSGLYGLADHWSIRKPIDVHLNLSSTDLKALRDAEPMMYWGRRFHRSMTRCEKKWRLESGRHLFLVILTVCPLVTLLCIHMLLKFILGRLLYILKTSNRSTLLVTGLQSELSVYTYSLTSVPQLFLNLVPDPASNSIIPCLSS